jgi:hypothetical protein
MHPRFLFASLLAFLLLGCDSTAPASDGGADGGPPPTIPDAGPPRCAPEDEGDPRAVFVLPRDGTEPFFDLPFPSDLRRTSEGTIDVAGFPNPRGNGFITRYLEAITERLDGFGTNGASYARFSRSVDPSTLPSTPEASIAADASVFLIDVDDRSPELGARHPVVLHYQDCETRYWPAHTVAVRPVYGIPLASARRYALVITDGVLPAGGGAFTRDADFEALVAGGGDAAVTAAAATYGDVFTVLGDHGVEMERVLALSVFTTQDAVGELIAVRDWMIAEYPAPEIIEGSVTAAREDPRLTELNVLKRPSKI